MHITPVPIRDRSVACGASDSRAGRTHRSHDTEHSRPVSKPASRIGRMSDPPRATGHMALPLGRSGWRSPPDPMR